MPLIKARDENDTKKVPLTGQITVGQHKLLQEYSAFVGEKPSYVLAKSLEYVAEKDREFQEAQRPPAPPTKRAKSSE